MKKSDLVIDAVQRAFEETMNNKGRKQNNILVIATMELFKILLITKIIDIESQLDNEGGECSE